MFRPKRSPTSSSSLHLDTSTPQVFTALQNLAREKLIELFPEHVCFAFQFNRITKQTWMHCDDFSLFVCLETRNATQEHLFRTILLNKQLQMGLHPNDEYSIEIMSKEELDQCVIRAKSEDVSTSSSTIDDNDFFRLTQTITSKKIWIHGDAYLLKIYETPFKHHQISWKEHILQELQKEDPLFVLNTVVEHQPEFASQKKQTEKFLLSVFHFDINPQYLKKIILSFALNGLDLIIQAIEKTYPEMIPANKMIYLDGADGDFDTYQPVQHEYSQTTSDLRHYIPFNKQFTFQNSDRDRRQTFMNFTINQGIVHETMRDELQHIVTGLGSGYILNKSIQAINNNKGHVFLIPVPTYGYFIPAIAACGAKPVFIDITSYERFALPPRVLEKVILQNNNDLYKSNIKKFIFELTNYVRMLKSQDILGEEIDQKIDFSEKEGKIQQSAIHFQKYLNTNLKALSIKYPKLSESMLNDFPEIPRVKCLFFINPHNPLGIIFDQDYINSIAEIASKYELTIIDDLSHMELIYPREPTVKMGFFNQATFPVDVVTLISPSKALCMAECRVGFAFINNIKLANAYNELVFNDGLFLSKKQLAALENSFILNSKRALYLKNNASEYMLRMEMLKYLLHPELREEIFESSHSKIKQLFEFYHLNIDDYKEGLEGIQLLNTNPESGFFCILDFTAIQGKYFLQSPINNNQDLWSLLRLFNITTLTGKHIYYTNKLVIRFPISEPPLLMLTAIKRLKSMMSLISNTPYTGVVPALSQVTSYEHCIHDKKALFVKPPLPNQLTKELAKIILDKSEKLKAILSEYQPENVTNYEIERAVRTLLKMDIKALDTQTPIDSMAVMLPSNLPLYSLVIFVIIPSFLSHHVYVRPNAILQKYDIISRIYEELGLSALFPTIQIINADHEGFSSYIKHAKLVVFTGKPSNAEKFLQEMKEDSLLVVNGAGHNPLVITEFADVDAAVEGALLVKGFNGGQDCAGPDAILVHQSIAREFIQKFQEKFSHLHTGEFTDPQTVVGPIHRFTELQKFAEMFHTNRTDILSGGIIDYKTGIVSPTIIARGIERRPNYKEIYGPVAFIHPYKTDQDLALYFDDVEGQYQSNRMYVSLYGQSPYLESRDDRIDPGKPGNVGIIIRNQTIHDVEIGYLPYGGYSLGASAIIRKSLNKKIERMAMPILLPEIIHTYLINGKSFTTKKHATTRFNLSLFASTTRVGSDIDPIVASFQELASSLFKENLLFGFIFGSAAKGKLKINGPDSDDLDTFVCIKEADPKTLDTYLQKLTLLHAKYHLKVDTAFPAEVMTLATLNEMIAGLGQIDVSVDHLVSGREFDHIFWTHALTDKKIGFLGDGVLMLSLIKQGTPHIMRWSKQIIEQLSSKSDLPKHLLETFPGLTKAQTIEKLKKYSPHLIVHLGLNYDTNNVATTTVSNINTQVT